MSRGADWIRARCVPCGRLYKTTRRAFWDRATRCPRCGSGKAQDVTPKPKNPWKKD